MNAQEQIAKFHEFFEKESYAIILENVRNGKNFLTVSFLKLSKFEPELADQLVEQPEETLAAAELAIKEFDLSKEFSHFYVRINNLPESNRILVRNVRSKHLTKMLWTEGIIRQKSDVRPQVTSARFECPSCGNVLTVLQLEKKFREPSRCSCGRKGKFKELAKELIDAQGIVLEEAPEDLEGGAQPKRINVLLKNDLVSPINDKRSSPGSKIRIMGWVSEVPIELRGGGKSTKFDLIFDANNLETVEEDYTNIEISSEEEEKIKELGRDPEVYKKLIASIAPSIYGHGKIKEALLLQLAGGSRKVRSDGMITRGDMHILLVGDPGAGKSQLLKRATIVAPKARYVTGKGVSGAGLTAAVVKDEFLGGWSLEAGALVLSNRGFVMIDEMDKMGKEDRSAMHEALEQQTVSISKANIQATLRAETTVLAAANPKLGRFDLMNPLAPQIDLPPTLINRFDLIFPIKDLPNKEKDERMAKHILGLHKDPSLGESDIPTDLLRKYLSYVRKKINPRITDEALDEIKTYYVEMRSKGETEELGYRTIPITARQLEALVRLAEASAKIRLSSKVLREDARRAIELLEYCLNEVARDMETGQIDIDRISSGIPAKQRNKIIIVKEIITHLEEKIGKNIPIEDLVEEAKIKDIKKEDVEDVIEKLKRQGDLFEPKRGFIQRII
jgi:replicative DNA helicase Mcm